MDVPIIVKRKMRFNIPEQITQGDRVTWVSQFPGFDPQIDTAALFIRGDNSLDLTGIPGFINWYFEISPSESMAMRAGLYMAQVVIFNAERRITLSTVTIDVLPSFENLTELDTRTTEQKELELLNEAIAKLSSGVAEYYIGDRRVRYTELPQLYERQKYLQNRLASMKNKSSIGGRNVRIRWER